MLLNPICNFDGPEYTDPNAETLKMADLIAQLLMSILECPRWEYLIRRKILCRSDRKRQIKMILAIHTVQVQRVTTRRHDTGVKLVAI